MTRKFIVTVNNEEYEVLVEEIVDEETQKRKAMAVPNNQVASSISSTEKVAQSTNSTPQQKPEQLTGLNGHSIVAPLPGIVLKVLVKQGEKVSSGQTLLILEAMKMENEINSPVSGIVSAILVNPNQNVNTNDLLITVE